MRWSYRSTLWFSQRRKYQFSRRCLMLGETHQVHRDWHVSIERKALLIIISMIDRVDIVIKTRILEPHSRRIILSRHRSSTLPITKNLFHALKHLRRQSESRIFWVDTICVNQEDLDERSSQVQRMADIYRWVVAVPRMRHVCHIDARFTQHVL